MDTGYPAFIPKLDSHNLRKKDDGLEKKRHDVEVQPPVLGEDSVHEEA